MKKLRTSCKRFTSALRLVATGVRRTKPLQPKASAPAFRLRRFGFNLGTETQLALTLALSRKRERGQSSLRRDQVSRFCGRDCRALLFPGPSRPRRAGGGNSREAGARRMRARPISAQGCAVSGPRSLLAESLGRDAQRPRTRGCPFLWLLSFGQAKESNRRPWMVDEMHMDVSRSSQKPTAQEQSQNGFPHPRE